MAIPDYVLVHTATPQRYLESQSSPPAWIEGEPGPESAAGPTAGAPFPCVLFLPGGGGAQSNQYRVRVVQTPQLLFNATAGDGTPHVLGAEDLVDVDAPELAPWLDGLETTRWLVNGRPQPFGPPGSVIGLLAILERVTD